MVAGSPQLSTTLATPGVDGIAEFRRCRRRRTGGSDAYKVIIPCRDKRITASYVIAEGM